MSADSVIEKIKEKAQAEIEQIIAGGKAKGEEIRSAVISDAENKATELKQKAERDGEVIIRGGELRAKTDGRIALVNKRHELLNAVKDDAIKAMSELDDSEWIKLYSRLISECELDGELSVAMPKRMIAGADDILRKWETVATEKSGRSVKLSLGGEYEDGVVLSGEKYDIDLSYSAVVDSIFEAHEKEISDELFGKE